MKIFQLIDLIIRLFKLNKKSKVVLLFLIPTFLVGQNNAAFWLGKRPSTGETDPYFSNVSLLLHMDGANGSTTFTDDSNNNFTVTRFGDTQISTSQSVFGGASAFLDGNGDYLTLPTDVDFDFGTSDFTVECWVYPITGSVNANPILMQFGDLSSNWSPIFGIYINGNYLVFISNTGTAWNIAADQLLGSITFNAWSHYALTRQGNVFRTFKNGIQQATWTSSADIYQQNNRVVIGAGQVSRFFRGYIDELRITKGVARYTSNFTVPTAPFPNN